MVGEEEEEEGGGSEVGGSFCFLVEGGRGGEVVDGVRGAADVGRMVTSCERYTETEGAGGEGCVSSGREGWRGEEGSAREY